MLPSSGGKRSLDAEINLVPFIDLLSVCICFLLMTAVWMQISTLQVKQSHGTEGAASKPGDMELDVQFGGPNKVQLALKKNGKAFKKAAFEGAEFSAVLASMDSQLTSWLGAPTKVDTGKPAVSQVSAAMVTPKAGVTYGNLVSAMDVLRKHHIVNLGVVPVGAK